VQHEKIRNVVVIERVRSQRTGVPRDVGSHLPVAGFGSDLGGAYGYFYGK